MADDDDTNSGDGEESAPGTGQYVTQLGPYDVLLGRGTGPSMHEGNVRFRQTVEDLKPAYVSTTSRKAKKDLVRRIVTAIKAQNGRFLTKLHKSETKMLGLDMAAYEVVRDSVAFEKTKQAIRYVHYKKEPAAARSSSFSSDLNHEGRKKKKRPVPRSSTIVGNFKDMAAATPSSSSNLTTSTPSSEQFARNPRSGDTSIADGRSVLSISDTARLVAPDSQSAEIARLQDLLLGGGSASSSSLWNSRSNVPQNQLSSGSMRAVVENLLQNPSANSSSYPTSIGATGSIIAPSLDPVLEGLRLRQQLNNVLSGRGGTTTPQGRSWLSGSEQASDLKQFLEGQPRNANFPSTMNPSLSLESQLQLILGSSPDRLLPPTDIGWNVEQPSNQQFLGQGLPLHPLNLTQTSSHNGSGDGTRLMGAGSADHPLVHEQLLLQQQLQQEQQSQLFAYLQAQEERQRIINSYLSKLPPR